ncbi:MAG TPA: HEAT repeat domain-containing protein [Steroidobacteraceae bacterium]|nr:HEAT repeat domain-containing protein [Steroidobacteraceae bacterium]
MSDKRKSGVPFESDDAGEQQLWSELEGLPQEAPSQRLRRRFYDELEHVDRRLHRRRRWFGWMTAPTLVAAMGCLFVGVMIGLLLRNQPAQHTELAQLQQQVAILNRNLVLDRLENDSASKRLLGVIEASDLAGRDPEVTRALLERAVDDRVHSVRSAAIDAIGPRLGTPAVGDELMGSLEKAQSPLVQLALADLVLRYGNPNQLEQLLGLSDRGLLHPDVAKHVKASVSRNPV